MITRRAVLVGTVTTAAIAAAARMPIEPATEERSWVTDYDMVLGDTLVVSWTDCGGKDWQTIFPVIDDIPKGTQLTFKPRVHGTAVLEIT